MKFLIRSVSFVCVALLIATACTDESKFNNPVHFELENGAFARFRDVNIEFLMGGNTPQEASFSGEIWDPNGNLASMEMFLVTASDTFLVDTYTSFPFDFTITGADIETLTGTTVSFGEEFFFESILTRDDGVQFTSTPLGPGTDSTFVGNTQENLLDPTTGYVDAMQFSLIIACPTSDPEWAVGTGGAWNYINDDWNGSTGTFTVTDGPETNQITLVDVFEPGFDVVVTFNDDGSATVPTQDCCVNPTFGQVEVTGDGLYFDCANLVILNLEHTVAAGSFGVYNLTVGF